MPIDAELASRHEEIRRRIAAAAARAGRDPAGITLVAVTKTLPAERVRDACGLGILDIGENRVQELIEKKDRCADLPIRWHLIGHLQTNKVKQVLRQVALIHSVDSAHLAQRIDELAGASPELPPVEVLMQVNTSGEATKFGIDPDGGRALAESIASLRFVRLRGLMTLGPLTEDEESIRRSFRLLRKVSGDIRDLIPGPAVLSMGMSGDFEIAIEEGATLVRMGTALFGPRAASPSGQGSPPSTSRPEAP